MSTTNTVGAAGPVDPLPAAEVLRLARLTLEEDLAGGVDVTTLATVAADSTCVADVVARRDGVLAGIPLARAVVDLVDPSGRVRVIEHLRDGDRVAPGSVVLTLQGPTRSVLTAERSLLNLLCHLSGIATLTARWVSAVAGTGAVVRDTRKTAPGLRAAQKYAVRCGGGANHRMGLADQALIKDNHLAAAGSIAAALAAVDRHAPQLVCEVECDTVDQVEQACRAGARLVLLDNMSLEQLRAAVVVARRHRVRTEASGGLELDGAREVALTGVDHLAVGALTHSAPALDLGLDLRPAG